MAQSSASGTSSRRHLRDHEVHSPSSPRFTDTEWENKEVIHYPSHSVLLRELEEAKARATQMEKTMRWWSDCTANWREKWCEVRDEKNKAKKEVKVYKSKLEASMKDVIHYREESQKLEMKNIELKKEMEKIQSLLMKHSTQSESHSTTNVRTLNLIDFLDTNDSDPSESLSSGTKINSKAMGKEAVTSREKICTSTDKGEDNIITEAPPKYASDEQCLISPISIDKADKRNSKIIGLLNDENLVLNFNLEETPKTIVAEEKSLLYRNIEKLKNEITELKKKCNYLQDTKADALKELEELRGKFEGRLNSSQIDLIDVTNRENIDEQLSELRAKLEKLQVENAAEWGKRELLESEKISLERENKQLRSEIYELQERIELKRPRPLSTYDSDSKQLEQEFLDRNKDLADLKHSYSKLKKMLVEKTTELSHAMRRSEQYEAEVKRIRLRVEELKKELACAQDEVDLSNNNVRKLQRINEDLIEQLELANSQLEQYKNTFIDQKTPDVVAEINSKQIAQDHDISIQKEQN